MTSNAAANHTAGKYSAEFGEIAVPDHFIEMGRNCDLFIAEDPPCGEGACSRWAAQQPQTSHLNLIGYIEVPGFWARFAHQREQAPSPRGLRRTGQTALVTTPGRGANTLTSTKLTSATLRL